MATSAMELARKRFIAERASFVHAGEQVDEALSALLKGQGIAGAHIKVRAKEVSSFVKKLHKYGDDCWAKTTDKLGAQIVVRTTAEVRRLRVLLEKGVGGMRYLYTTDKSTSGHRELRYAGIHVQVEMLGCTTSEGEPIECEIQLRTQSQDVWAALEHGLVYKPDLELPPELERKILRLSVLVEMFDEEVDAVMAQLEKDPRYFGARVLRQAERWFLTFVSEAGERELSMEVLESIQSSFSDQTDSEYAAALEQFVQERRDKIARALSDYGEGSAYVEQFNYFLFTQPECIVIWERLENHRLALARAVRGSEIQPAVAALADVWGQSLEL